MFCVGVDIFYALKYNWFVGYWQNWYNIETMFENYMNISNVCVLCLCRILLWLTFKYNHMNNIIISQKCIGDSNMGKIMPKEKGCKKGLCSWEKIASS